jgi:hypothetical protein
MKCDACKVERWQISDEEPASHAAKAMTLRKSANYENKNNPQAAAWFRRHGFTEG